MSIYGQVSSNKRRTFVLILLFIVFFSFIFFLIGKVVNDPENYLIIGFVIAVLSSFGSYFWSDKLVLASTRSKPANKKEHFNFYTIAENISIASGLPMPKLYVIEDESLNAFATGRNSNHAVVVTTTGLLKKLNRSELEGVVAHEFSHVKNYDILLASVVAALVGTLVLVVDFVNRGWFYRVADENRKSLGPLFLILFVVTMLITPLIATLIQLAVSRKREYLADASGALITRFPDGLAAALEKISKDPVPLKRASGATAHLFIDNPFKEKKFKSRITNLFRTHPPVEERIKILRSM